MAVIWHPHHPTLSSLFGYLLVHSGAGCGRRTLCCWRTWPHSPGTPPPSPACGSAGAPVAWVALWHSLHILPKMKNKRYEDLNWWLVGWLCCSHASQIQNVALNNRILTGGEALLPYLSTHSVASIHCHRWGCPYRDCAAPRVGKTIQGFDRGVAANTERVND